MVYTVSAFVRFVFSSKKHLKRELLLIDKSEATLALTSASLIMTRVVKQHELAEISL